MRIETPRLVIRTYEHRDAQAWLAMVTDPDVLRFLPPGPTPTMEAFAAALERRHTMEREHGYAVWAVDVKETGAFVGQCGYYPAERTGPEIEIVYHYGKAAWNKGYGTEAATAVLAHGFGTIGF